MSIKEGIDCLPFTLFITLPTILMIMSCIDRFTKGCKSNDSSDYGL